VKSLADPRVKWVNCRRKSKEREALWWHYRHGGPAPDLDWCGQARDTSDYDAAIAQAAVAMLRREGVDYDALGEQLGLSAEEAEQQVDEFTCVNGHAEELPAGVDIMDYADELLARLEPAVKRALRPRNVARARSVTLAWLWELSLLLLLSLLGTSTPQPAAVSTGEARSGAPPGRARRRRRRQAVALCARRPATREAGHVGRLHAPLGRAEAAI
jgi:hypothetical protein